MSEPTDRERARWWRDGWARAWSCASVLDRLTVRLEQREWRSVVRLARAVRRADEHRTGREPNTSREGTACQG